MCQEELGGVLQGVVEHARLLPPFDDHQRHHAQLRLNEMRRKVLALQPDDGGSAATPVEQLHPIAAEAEKDGEVCWTVQSTATCLVDRPVLFAPIKC